MIQARKHLINSPNVVLTFYQQKFYCLEKSYRKHKTKCKNITLIPSNVKFTNKYAFI